MNLLKETLALSDNATFLLCDIEKLDYTASRLIESLESHKENNSQQIVINHTKTAINIMFDYISALEKNIKKTAQQTDAVFHYIKEQTENGKEKIEN